MNLSWEDVCFVRGFYLKGGAWKSVFFLSLGFIIGVVYVALLINLAQFSSNPILYQATRESTNLTCTFDYYERLLDEMGKERYAVLRVVDFIRLYRNDSLPLDKVIVILRHDVDFSPSLAYRMADLEMKYGIRSTYYIRTRGPYNILGRGFHDWLKNLSDLGFEVGLHYETLYYSNYNFTEAERLLESDLNLLRSIVPVYTVCSHGNAPRQKYINYEVFIRNPGLYSRLRIEGEAYLTVFRMLRELKKSGVIRDYVYLSDTYRRDIDWIGRLRNASRGEIIYTLIHPDNWRT